MKRHRTSPRPVGEILSELLDDLKPAATTAQAEADIRARVRRNLDLDLWGPPSHHGEQLTFDHLAGEKRRSA